jgi:hypothetical protein
LLIVNNLMFLLEKAKHIKKHYETLDFKNKKSVVGKSYFDGFDNCFPC